MSDTLSEKVSSDASSDATTLSQRFQDQLEAILRKLRIDPSTITAEEARILSENVATRDDRANGSSQAQALHRSLLMAAKDLHIAVDGSPDEATTEVLRVAQSIVSKLQKAVGQTNAPHPEVEAELQEEIAKIEPKIAQGTVTKAEADHLHSLEARAHGHTEKGGIAAVAQSVAARRERQLSLSSSGSMSSPINGRSRANSRSFTSPQQQLGQEKGDTFPNIEMIMRAKIEANTAAKPGMDKNSLANYEYSRLITEKISAARLSHRSKDENLHNTETAIFPQAENGTLTQAEADCVPPQAKRGGHVEKSELSPIAQSFVSSRRQESLSGVSNSSATEHRKEQSQPDKDLNKVDEELEDNEVEAYAKTLAQNGHGRVDENGKFLAEPSYNENDR